MSASLNSFNNFLKGIDLKTQRIYNLSGSSPALLLSLLGNPFVLITGTEEESIRLYNDITFFNKLIGRSNRLYHLPDPDGLERAGKRAEVLYEIGRGDSIILSINSFNSPAWSKEELEGKILSLLRGQEFERERLMERLIEIGYRRVSLVIDKGEFSSRGWILDIFPVNRSEPIRIEFYGDEIEVIRSFDIESQRSLKDINDLTILPAVEPDDGRVDIKGFGYSMIYYTDSALKQLQKKESDVEHFCLLSSLDISGEGFRAGSLSMGGLGILPGERRSFSDLGRAIKSLSRDNRVIIVSASQGQAMRLKELLFDEGIIAPVLDIGATVSYEGNINITSGELSSGLFIEGLLILTEREIFGERPHYRPMKRSKVSGLLTSLNDISPGDLVVHSDHGIGRFLSIERKAIGGDGGSIFTDFAVIEYAGGDRLYLPLYNIERIKKYNGGEGVIPSIDRLGGKTWQRKKARVKRAVKEMAEKLLKLYAEREISKGFSFSPDTELHREFYDFFPYEETPDQIRSFEEIRADMESDRPMDRLLCGDVGYGKTEVAMRAAFKAVYDGKQVAVLVPTTILCEQHYYTFTSRFRAFPVKIDYLSRFKSKAEQASTLRALSRGEIDIIIGTQALLGKDISFYDLGLLIIDEEHRFGVAQKERIKELKKGVDVLSMTATPIPRTLQMALSGIRSMSIIETPPEERVAVRSLLSVFDKEFIKEAIERELSREGQVLFVHNFIHDIDDVAVMIKRLFPEVRSEVAHGDMPPKRLERIIIDFMKGDIKILIATNIIGSGIDIPNANTIIINRADRLGLADLYQLKGRVGRSNVRAYAFFLIPGEDLITEEARKRLDAIREMSYLGAGFRVAMKDLEIRGSGNLLGPEQSGHIHAVGFDTYLEILEKAVAELKGEEIKEEIEPVLNLNIDAHIPEEYIEDVTIRLSMYRRVARARSEEEIQELASEMRDRFGNMPVEVKNLLEIVRLKTMAKKLMIKNILERNGRIRFSFLEETPVKVEDVSGLYKRFQGIRFHSDGFELPIKKEAVTLAEDVLRCLQR
ncbi:MAG: transcription-repair coupling factor [Thermodesulfovibrionales bacterium]